MNYSTAVFLINDDVRAIACTYEAGDNAPRTIFKTFDKTIKEGDLVVVPTSTRHHMTVVKVAETDVDFDIETPAQMEWIVGIVEQDDFEETKKKENEAIELVKAAERKKKRDDLRAAVFGYVEEEKMKNLQIASSAALADEQK